MQSTSLPAEDESIDNYMERLLKRVRGESTTDAGAWKQSQPASAISAASAIAPAAAPLPTPAALPPPAQIAPEPESDYIPRTTAPEGTLGLSAMRDLANTAARTAIETHIRKHTGRQAIGKLVTATLISATSTVLGYWAWKSHSLAAGVGAGVGAAAGLFWTLAALRRIVNVMRRNRQQPPQDPTAPVAGSTPAV